LPEQYRRKATWRHVSTETAKAADGNKDLLEICVSLRLVLALEGVEMPNAMTDDLPNEETDNPLLADDRNYYKVEKWTKDGTKVDRMLYAGNNLDKARQLFANALKHRPRSTKYATSMRSPVTGAGAGRSDKLV
jgi:hypothetical protein